MTSNEIRSSFLDYFRKQKHTIVPSASVIPAGDPTILFTNAGMNQFKDVFLGTGTRPYTRVANTQKCIRVSGKHNDLEEVGYDGHHHTFFEMLGNWSFGDYYKKEAIQFAWELITEVWKIPKDRIWATIYLDDDEAEKLWYENTDIIRGRVLRFDAKENFWEMGETGPCGPCSELFVDLGPEADPNFKGTPEEGVNVSDRFREFWNLVFIQYDRDENGKLHPLPKTHIDTGMGFERITAIMQGVESNYETDVFMPILNTIAEITDQPYAHDPSGVPHRVIADHVRCLTFAIGDGVMPSNDGRGYVMRRILRRAVLYGKRLGMAQPFIYRVVDAVIDQLGDVFSDVKPRVDFVKKIIKSEENRFHQTLDRGLEILENSLIELEKSDQKILSGDRAFELYDTFGFPLDLTQVLARERNFAVDELGFDKSMEAQRNRSRAAWRGADGDRGGEIFGDLFREFGATNFIGYERTASEATVIAMIKNGELTASAVEGETIDLILNRTPFYGESGGQIGDVGKIERGGIKLKVIDTKKPLPDLFVHKCKVIEGEIFPQMEVGVSVDPDRRQKIAVSHTATHILHHALWSVLGTHIGQAGSLVEGGRLRFDFTHFESVSDDQLREIEEIINDKVRQNDKIRTDQMSLKSAKDRGALAFFGDKYGEIVRVVEIGDYSVELCGGTHVDATGEIGLVKITAESSISAGTRRIEALTGGSAFRQQRDDALLLRQITSLLRSPREEAFDRIERLLKATRDNEKELQNLQSKIAISQTADLINSAETIDGIKTIAKLVENVDRNSLRKMVDDLKNRLGSGAIVMAGTIGDEVAFIAGVTDDLVKNRGLKAGDLIREVTAIAGGRGGGRPDLAQGGSKDPSRAQTAIDAVPKLIAELCRKEN